MYNQNYDCIIKLPYAPKSYQSFDYFKPPSLNVKDLSESEDKEVTQKFNHLESHYVIW